MPTRFRPTPAIPNIPASTPRELQPVLRAMRDASMVRFGQNQNRLDRSITVRELIDLGVISGDGTNLSLNRYLADAIGTDQDGNPGPTQGPVPTPDISAVEFSVNTRGVIITWGVLEGAFANALNYTEIWRVGPFTALADGSYPPMNIGQDGDGNPSASWVDPVNALDDQGAPLPNPELYLSGVTLGYIYGEALEPGQSYVYFLRFMGADGVPTAWHSLTGTQVDAVVDFQYLLDVLEGQITEQQLNSTLQDSIVRIDDLDIELNNYNVALTNFQSDTAANFLAEATTRAEELAAEASERRRRWRDTIQYLSVVNSSWDVQQESQILINDSTISEVRLEMNEADAALALQIQAVVAASGVWYMQAVPPGIDPTWDGAYHWLDTDEQNRHYVSTDITRADSEELLTSPPIPDASWVEPSSGAWTMDGSQTIAEFLYWPSIVAAGSQISVGCRVSNHTTGQVRFVSGGSSTEWFGTPGLNEMYNFDFVCELGNLNLEASVDFDGQVESIYARPLAVNVWPESPTIGDGWSETSTGVFQGLGDLVDSDISAVGVIPAEGEYKITFTSVLPSQGVIGVVVNGQEIAQRAGSGFFTVTFNAPITNSTVALRSVGGYNGRVENIQVKLTSGWQGWVDVTDSRIDTTFAAIVTEELARTTADEALATQITTIQSRIDSPTTGLDALATAQNQTLTYINDDGPDGFLAQSNSFENLRALVLDNQSGIAAETTARQDLAVFINDTGPDGYIQQTLFGTELGSQLADSISGNFASQAALDTLETYLADSTENGFLASVSRFTQLEQDVQLAASGATAAQSAVDSLELYLNDSGPGGFLQSATRFTNLENSYTDIQAELTATSQLSQTLDSFVRDDGPSGLLAGSTYLQNQLAAIDASKANISYVDTAIADENTARAAAISQLEADVAGEYATAQQLTEVAADIEGNLLARYSNKIELTTVDGEQRITGFEFFDSNGPVGTSSNFVIQTDVFAIRSASDPTKVPFSMNGDAINLDFDAINLQGVIPSANIAQLEFTKIIGGEIDGTNFTLGDGVVTSAAIAAQIRSDNFVPQESGWVLLKNGYAQFQNILARGDIRATSLAAEIAMVDTLNIDDEAVTIPRGVAAYGGNRSISGNTRVDSVSIDWGADRRGWPENLLVIGMVNFLASSNNNTGTSLYAWIDTPRSNEAGIVGATQRQNWSSGCTPMAFVDGPSQQVETYHLECSASESGFGIGSYSLFILGARR